MKCEHRLSMVTPETKECGLFRVSQMELFAEESFMTPQYAYHFVRAPIARLGFLYGIRKLDHIYNIPEPNQIYQFLSDLFVQAQLSPECSVGKCNYSILQILVLCLRTYLKCA